MVRRLLRHGGNPLNAGTNEGDATALWLAAHRGWAEVVTMLITAGADPTRPHCVGQRFARTSLQGKGSAMRSLPSWR